MKKKKEITAKFLIENESKFKDSKPLDEMNLRLFGSICAILGETYTSDSNNVFHWKNRLIVDFNECTIEWLKEPKQTKRMALMAVAEFHEFQLFGFGNIWKLNDVQTEFLDGLDEASEKNSLTKQEILDSLKRILPESILHQTKRRFVGGYLKGIGIDGYDYFFKYKVMYENSEATIAD